MSSLAADNWDDDSYWSEESVEEFKDGKRTTKTRRGKRRARGADDRVRLGNINSQQRMALKNRIESKDFWSFGFGPFAAAGLEGTNNEMLYGASITKHWEANLHGEVRASIAGAFGPSSIGAATIGGAYLFSTSSFSPYLGAEFGGGVAGNQGGGFAGKAVLGTRIFRTSDAQIDFGLSYLAIFSEGTPGVAGAQLGILF
jgi:hypothetical protein